MSIRGQGTPGWWVRWFGLDPIDLGIHVAGTGFAMVVVDGLTLNEPLTFAAGLAGILAYGWRRRRVLDGLPAAPAVPTPLPAGLAELLDEQADQLEQVERRVLELEERLDFAERLLARPPEAEPARPAEITPVGGMQ